MDDKETQDIVKQLQDIVPESHGYVLICGKFVDGKFQSQVTSNMEPMMMVGVIKNTLDAVVANLEKANGQQAKQGNPKPIRVARKLDGMDG